MTITFSDHHVPILLAALEAYERFKINQPETAFERMFPKECLNVGWRKVAEICVPFHSTFFPNHPTSGGPSICSQEAGDARIAYEIQKTIQQYVALQKSGGWFGNTVDFDGNLLNPSGLPPPKIKGLAEMQYMDFYIPDEYQATARNYYDHGLFSDLFDQAKLVILGLPRGEEIEIIKEKEGANKDSIFIRVHKPRKPLDSNNF